MAKTVGFSRNIKLKWLSKAAELYREKLSEAEYKNALNDYLSFEIDSPTNLSKTREILMKIWYYNTDDVISVMRERASGLTVEYPDESSAVHWCLMLSVFPVFNDLCKYIGRFAEMNDIIVLNQIKKKLYDEWGERSTLFYSTDKIIATMKEFEAIYSEKPGKYRIVKHKISKPEIISMMTKTAMRAIGSSYYTLGDLSGFGVLFPYEYDINKVDIMSDSDFVIANFGGETTVALK